MTTALPAIWKLQNALCWRLARIESPPLAAHVAPAELPLLMEILEEAGGLVDDPDSADKPFKSPQGVPSRFSDGSYGVFYAGLDLDTCVAEVSHHQARHFRESSAPPMFVHFRPLRAKVSGSFVDVRRKHPELHDLSSYANSSAFGAKVLKAGAPGIAYRSVRHTGGECLAVFHRDCILSCKHSGTSITLAWDGATISKL